jgi:hypothetical protein
MTIRPVLVTALTMAAACQEPSATVPAGEISIAIQQSLTGQTTSSGTFIVTGAMADDGQTTEELVFGGPLTAPTVPLTFRRVLTGKRGSTTVRGSAVLTWTQAGAATLTGSWEMERGDGVYVTGGGTLEGRADFAATPPAASLTYHGTLNR